MQISSQSQLNDSFYNQSMNSYQFNFNNRSSSQSSVMNFNNNSNSKLKHILPILPNDTSNNGSNKTTKMFYNKRNKTRKDSVENRYLDDSSVDSINEATNEKVKLLQQPSMRFKARTNLERIIDSIEANTSLTINKNNLKKQLKQYGLVAKSVYAKNENVKKKSISPIRKKTSVNNNLIDKLELFREKMSKGDNNNNDLSKKILEGRITVDDKLLSFLQKKTESKANVIDEELDNELKEAKKKELHIKFEKKTIQDLNRIKEASSFKKILESYNKKLHFKAASYYFNNYDDFRVNRNKKAGSLSNSHQNLNKSKDNYNYMEDLKDESDDIPSEDEHIVNQQKIILNNTTSQGYFSKIKNNTSRYENLNKTKIGKDIKKTLNREFKDSKKIGVLGETKSSLSKFGNSTFQSGFNPFLSAYNKVDDDLNKENFRILKNDNFLSGIGSQKPTITNSRHKLHKFDGNGEYDPSNRPSILFGKEMIKLEDIEYLSKQVLKKCNYLNSKNMNNNKSLRMGEGKLSCTNGMTLNEFYKEYKL